MSVGTRVSVSGYVLFWDSTGPPTAVFSIDDETEIFHYTPSTNANATYSVYYTSQILSPDAHTLTVTLQSANDANFCLDSFGTTVASIIGGASVIPAEPDVRAAPTPTALPLNGKNAITGPIVGGVVGGVATSMAIFAILLFCLFRWKYPRTRQRRKFVWLPLACAC